MAKEKCLKADGSRKGIVRLYVVNDIVKLYYIRFYKRQDDCVSCKLDMESVKTSFQDAVNVFEHYKNYLR